MIPPRIVAEKEPDPVNSDPEHHGSIRDGIPYVSSVFFLLEIRDEKVNPNRDDNPKDFYVFKRKDKE